MLLILTLTPRPPGVAKTDADQIKMITTFCDRAFSENAMRGRNREPPLDIREMDDLARWVFWNEISCFTYDGLK